MPTGAGLIMPTGAGLIMPAGAVLIMPAGAGLIMQVGSGLIMPVGAELFMLAGAWHQNERCNDGITGAEMSGNQAHFMLKAASPAPGMCSAARLYTAGDKGGSWQR